MLRRHLLLILLLVLLVGSVKAVQSLPIVPSQLITSAAAPTTYSWADWPCDSEATLATANIFVCLMENTTAASNEVGQGGGLSGADLVVTQAGSINGAVGSPPYRYIDTDDVFTITVPCADLITGGAWTVLMKMRDKSSGDFFQIGSWSAPNWDYIQIYSDVAADIRENDISKDSAALTDTMPTTGTYWIGAWYDGTYLRWGFTNTGSGAGGQPTKWSDFATTKRRTATTTVDYTIGCHDAMNRFGYAGVGYATMKIYCIVLSNTCLINNSL